MPHQYLLHFKQCIMESKHTTKEININEIRIDLGSFTWHVPQPLYARTK